MIQLTEKQVKTLTNAAIMYKEALRDSPKYASTHFGTLLVDNKSPEMLQLLDFGLATEEAPDETLTKVIADLKEKEGIELRVLLLTKEAVMMFMDVDKRVVN